MRVSVDTNAGGAAELVAGVTRVNIRDALRSEPLKNALLWRVKHRRDLLKYGDDNTNSPFKTDEWAAFSVTAVRCGALVKLPNGLWAPGDPEAVIIDDCEGLSAIYGAGFILDETPCDVWVGITHPNGTDQAHAFNVLGHRGKLKVFDGSVIGGMRRPRLGWYGQAEMDKVLIEPLASGRYH